MTSTRLDRIAGAEAPIGEPSPAPAGLVAGSSVRTTEPTYALFMTTTTKCPACRLLQQAAGLPVSRRIHVRRSGEFLIITDAEDLHRPGLPLIAKHAVDIPGMAMFQLVSESPASMPAWQFRPAAGTVTLGLSDGHWTLTAVGRADGAATMHDHIYHATEIRD